MSMNSMDAVNLIQNMDEVELADVIDAVKLRREFLNRRKMRAMVAGDRVWFDSSRGRVYGTITKINRKTVGVRADSGTNWRVAVSLLNRETVE